MERLAVALGIPRRIETENRYVVSAVKIIMSTLIENVICLEIASRTE